MYRCEECGKLFMRPRFEEECVGEYWGVPAYQTVALSPCCGDNFYEVDDDAEGEHVVEYEDEYGYDDYCSGIEGFRIF